MSGTQIAVKENIRKRLDYLSENEALRVLAFIDTFEDEEPLTEDELAQIEASKADIAAGRVSTLEEVMERLANLP